MYTEKDLNEDFEFLYRRINKFHNFISHQSYDELCEFEELNDKYFGELNKCYISLIDKYKPYFPEIDNIQICAFCSLELFTIHEMMV